MSDVLSQIWAPLAQVLGIAQGAAAGGLPALLAQLENAGLAERVQSWVGHGENLPIAAAELEVAFTPEQLNDWATKAGTTSDTFLNLMSKDLPSAVSQVTRPGEPRGP